MGVLRGLNEEETRTLLHKLTNTGRSATATNSELYLTNTLSKDIETKLAKLSEDENYNLKNRYRH